MFGIFNKNKKEEVKEGVQEVVVNNDQIPSVNQKLSEKPEQNTDGKIQFEDFAKIEMTVGEIIEAEKVENADRLLKLKVDFGTEQRQIVSGIAEYFKPEELIGKKTPFVTNLAPREIRGIESNGMILAAKDKNGNFSLMNVDEKIEKGTKLS